MPELSQEPRLCSQPAKTFFTFASIMTLVLIAFLALVIAGVFIAGEDRIQGYLNHWWVQAVGFVIGVVGTICAVALWIGMLSHCATTNTSRKGVRVVWLLFIIFGNWIVALFYYFFAYRKQSAG
jgi:hypothetical protein